MTISANVRKELFEMSANEGKLIRIKPTEAKAGTTVYSSKQAQPLKMWTQEEHEKFLEAMEKYPAGPWKVIAAFIGTKTTRQTMTHAQKYRQKIGRWRRGLRHKGRKQQADEAAASEAESAKDSLFKAIEYVSSDETSHYGGDGSSPARSVAGSVDGGSGGGGGPSELFRLAELASIEGMKQEPPQQQQQLPSMPVPPMPVPMSVTPSSPADVEMDDVSAAARIQIKQESGDQYMYKLKQQQMEWGYGYPHGHGTNHHEIRLSPLRGAEHHAPSRRVLSAISGLSFMNAQHAPPLPLPASYGLHPRSPSVVGSPERDMSDDDEFRRPFRLPPLNIAAQGTSAFAIPPLRSKIDPSVLGGRPQFA